MPLSKMGNEFSKIIEPMHVGEFRGPIIHPNGTTFIYLEEIKEARLKPYIEVTEAIEKFLKSQKRNNKKNEYIKLLKNKHIVKIMNQ